MSLGSKMDDNAAREDACREYQSSLEDLTFNSKPHINMLTILAEENLNFAKDIVAIIEAQISKVFINTEYFQFRMFYVDVCRPSRRRAIMAASVTTCHLVTTCRCSGVQWRCSLLKPPLFMCRS